MNAADPYVPTAAIHLKDKAPDGFVVQSLAGDNRARAESDASEARGTRVEPQQWKSRWQWPIIDLPVG